MRSLSPATLLHRWVRCPERDCELNERGDGLQLHRVAIIPHVDDGYLLTAATTTLRPPAQMCTFEPITIRNVVAQSLSPCTSTKMTASRGRLTVSRTVLSPYAPGRNHLSQPDVARLDSETYDKASEYVSLPSLP
jgi:hypothetical protein